jgi:hypothetical protein
MGLGVTCYVSKTNADRAAREERKRVDGRHKTKPMRTGIHRKLKREGGHVHDSKASRKQKQNG